MRTSPFLAPLLLALPLLAAEPTGGEKEEKSAPELELEAVRAIGEQRYERARELLDELLVRRYAREARELFAAGNPQDGLLKVDRALEVRPDDPRALLLFAEGSLLLADDAAGNGGSALFVEAAYADALDAYRRVPTGESAEGARVLLGASRAAYQLGRGSEALEYARQGLELAEAAPTELAGVTPERIWAQAALVTYQEERAQGASEDDAAALFSETEEALHHVLGQSPQDAWGWAALARLYQGAGYLSDATDVLQRGLDHVPRERGLVEALVEVARQSGGTQAVRSELEALLERHPGSPDATWHLALARFDEALERLNASEPDPELFSHAEKDFARFRELAPERASDALGYEAMCRDGRGWSWFRRDELERARVAFLSMEEIFEGGMAWQIEGRLLSGVRGLELVAARYNERQDWESAAEIYGLLHEYQPQEVVWANNAGFFHRDAAVGLEVTGARLCASARGEPLDPALRQRLAASERGFRGTPAECEELARTTLASAREHMEASYDAYRAAAELAPEDVRILNDTALVAIYYLQRDFESAERLLLRCIELGERQLAAEGLDEDARWELQNAWGDAYQNLGVLHLQREGDLERAETYFRRSLEIGPDPRPLIKDVLLPLCGAPAEARRAAPIDGLRPWAVPCD